MTSVSGLGSNGYLLSLFGGGTASSAPTMSALEGYQPYVANENQKVATYSQQASVQQAVSYFKANIGNIKSVTQLTQNPQLFNFVLTAFGLQSDSNEPALIAGVINSDLSSRTSLANQLIDPRYQQLAKEFDANQYGLSNFADPTVINDVVTRYLTNAYEYSLDKVNPALQNAAYFLRNIGSVTNAYGILDDPVLRNVFEATTGLPAQIANLPVQDEAKLVNSKVNISEFETTSSSSTSSGSGTSSALTTAQNQLSSLSTANSTVTAATSVVQSVVTQIQSIQQAYTNLATVQNPNGQFSAEIPVQEAAAPGLTEQQGVLATAQSALGTTTSNLSQLQALIQQAGSSTNTTPISTLQAEFATLTSQITSAISGASYQYDNGTGGTSYTGVNILDGSTTSPIVVQYDSKGDTTTVNGQNLGSSSTFQAQLQAAKQAFQAVSGSTDSANIQAASSALSSAQNAANFVSQSVGNDATNFQKAISSVPQWAGTYDTAALYRGTQSVADAGSRITQINQLLGQIQGLAQQSAQMSPTADRTSLQTQYTGLISQLNTAITQTTNPNVDNLLETNPGATSGYYSYSIDTGGNYTIQARTNDFVSSVLTPLQNLDVSSTSGANAVISSITGSIQTAIAGASSELGVDSQTFSLPGGTIDPRAAVDNQYRDLATNMSNVVNQAARNGTNLLDATQSGINITVSSTNQTVTLNPEDFAGQVTQVLTTGSEHLPSDSADTSGAIAQLNQAAFNASNILDDLHGALNQVQFATGVTNANIASLQKQQQNQSTSSAGLPSNPSAYAIQFVQKYLVTVDAQNSTGSNSSYVTQLFSGSQSLSQTIGSALLSGVNLTA
jgi:hypothetical protein